MRRIDELAEKVAKEHRLNVVRLNANPGTSDGILKTSEWHRALLESESALCLDADWLIRVARAAEALLADLDTAEAEGEPVDALRAALENSDGL